MLSAQLISDAGDYLRGRIRHTPVEYSHALSRLAGVPVWLKLEHLQLTGSFKIRGAWFRLSQLTAEEGRAGVLTASAGNHGKGVAYASRELGVKAIVCVPSSIDAVKHEGMLRLGAEVRVSPYAGYDDTEQWAVDMAARERLPFLSAFDDPFVMAGNGGSLCAEVLQQAPDASTFLVPVGGGGLAAGFSYLAKMQKPECRIIGCQLEASPALALSLERGEAVLRLPAVETVAGGLEGGIGAGPFAILKTRVDGVALLSEQEVLEGMRWMFDQHQYLIEPSSAVTIAALLSGKVTSLRTPIAVCVCGRNVSGATARRILCSH